MNKIFVFTYGGYDCPLQLDEEFNNRKEFLEYYEKLSKNDKQLIIYIIEGKQLEPKPKKKEIITEWKLQQIKE